LGLSIVYGIIEQHHGTIAAMSKEGEGTRFIIRLPYKPSAADERPPV
jgi:signal transduction histidine kinase